MSAFKHNGKDSRIGFSTGALERGDFQSARAWLDKHHVYNVEFSALRYEELEPLVCYFETVPLHSYSYVSFHAPTMIPAGKESHVVDLLTKVKIRRCNIIVHPDVIQTPELWRTFGSQLLIENMDRRKKVGRTVRELKHFFEVLPEARLCLDVAHARQLDTTLTLLKELIREFLHLVTEVHISELDSWCKHRPMSEGAVSDYQRIAASFRQDLPVIIESMLDGSRASLRLDELELAEVAMKPTVRRSVS